MQITDNKFQSVYSLTSDADQAVKTTKTQESVDAKSPQIRSQQVSNRKIAFIVTAVLASGALIALGISLFKTQPSQPSVSVILDNRFLLDSPKPKATTINRQWKTVSKEYIRCTNRYTLEKSNIDIEYRVTKRNEEIIKRFNNSEDFHRGKSILTELGLVDLSGYRGDVKRFHTGTEADFLKTPCDGSVDSVWNLWGRRVVV